MVNSLTKELIKLSTKLNPISVGTKFFPTNSVETEYVELFNYTPKQSQGYLVSNVERFYIEVIEPTKDELFQP